MTTILAAAVLAFVTGTLVEYWTHRLMHAGAYLSKRHTAHHAEGTGQGMLGEFRDYVGASAVVIVLVIALCAWTPGLRWFGVGFLIGDLAQMAFAAYAHQVQHERPALVFWMKQPVHFMHHHHKQWRHNFGISVDWWDRAFGTYRAMDWNPEVRGLRNPVRSFLTIKWL